MGAPKKTPIKIKKQRSISISDEALNEINKFKKLAWLENTDLSPFILQCIRFYVTKYKEQESEEYPELKEIDENKII